VFFHYAMNGMSLCSLIIPFFSHIGGSSLPTSLKEDASVPNFHCE